MQITCRLLSCYLCHLDGLDLSGVSLYHGLGATAQIITLRLPLHDRQMATNQNSGTVAPTDVDWSQLDAGVEGK